MTTTILSHLQALGSTDRQVFDRLLEAGIKGNRISAYQCPIARWLQSKGFPDASVNSYAVTSGFEDGPHWEAVTPPEPVQRFITLFDNGIFPELDEAPALVGA